MELPFTLDEFLDLFGAYNRATWPVALALWVASVAAVGRLLVRGRSASIGLWIVLTLLWAWSGAVYHLVFFRRINPAALLFGVAFLLEAALLAWRGIAMRRLQFQPHGSLWSGVGLVLMGYALIYPALGLLFGLEYPRMPTYAVPCPTTILTVGALVMVRDGAVRWLAVIPLLWTLLGCSAALQLGVEADFALPVAGLLLLIYIVRPMTSRSEDRNLSDESSG